MNKQQQQNFLKQFHFSSFTNCMKNEAEKTVTLFDFLSDVRKGLVKQQCIKLRETTDKKTRESLKKDLPCVSLSGIFGPKRKAENLKEHSGLLQIDFDQLESVIETKEILNQDKYTLAAFISPSGNGLKVIVRIEPDKLKHEAAFTWLKDYYLNSYALQIDEKCKDVSRLFFYSYDEKPFLNVDARICKAENAKSENEFVKIKGGSANKDLFVEVEIILQRINEKCIDLTTDYNDWLKIGFAFAQSFGEAGRKFFHEVSRFNAEYDPNEADKQYTKCLQAKGSKKVNIQTFFHLAKTKGVDISIKETRNLKGTASAEKAPDIKPEPKEREDETHLNPKFVFVEKYLRERYEFRYNESCNELQAKPKDEGEFKTANPDSIYYNMKRENVSMNRADFDALLRSDIIPRFDEMTNYFENLPEWDDKTDHIEKLANYVKAKDQERFNRHFKKALVRTVKQALTKGYYNKHCFVIVGEKQHTGKSYFINFLCPQPLKEYISDTFTGNKANKDELLSICENFIINLEELSVLSKTDINQLKAFFTYNSIKQRKTYDKVARPYRRRASFWASTNSKEFLEDTTGSVRWLCFEIDEIDHSYSKNISINDVYAQAYSLYKSGFNCEMSKEEQAENEEANKEHMRISMEQELIAKHFEADAQKRKENFNTATDILQQLLKIVQPGTRINQNNIGKACCNLGFPKSSERINGTPKKGYYVLPVAA